MAPTPTGRPSKLTPEVQERICNLLKAGNTFRTACEVAGIGYFTGNEWRQRGEGNDPDRPQTDTYAQFAQAVRRAEEEAAVRNVGIIQQAAKQSWQAAAWWLERKFPAEWARTDRHMLAKVDDQRKQLAQGMSLEQLRARVIELATELGFVSPAAIGAGDVIEVEVEEVEEG